MTTISFHEEAKQAVERVVYDHSTRKIERWKREAPPGSIRLPIDILPVTQGPDTSGVYTLIGVDDQVVADLKKAGVSFRQA